MWRTRSSRNPLDVTGGIRLEMPPVTADAGVALDGLPFPRRIAAISALSLAILLAVLDTAVANVALPTIARDLHVSAADAIWVVNAYQLAVTVALLPLSSLGDIRGYRPIYLAGLAVFTMASLLCAMSDSLLTLTLARAVQGFGAAGIMSVNTALIRFIYPRHLLGRGLGIGALVVAIASAIGPTVASAILLVGHWPLLFAINVPLGVLAFFVAMRALPHTPRAGHRFDRSSALLSAVTFGAFISMLDGLAHGQVWLGSGGEAMLAIGAGFVLLRRQRSVVSPLLPVDLLRIPVFALSTLTSLSAFAAQSLAYVALPFHLQTGLHFDQTKTGVMMTPWPVAIAFVAPIAGRLADRASPGLLCAGGLAVLGLGLFTMAVLPNGSQPIWIVFCMTLCGLGFGFFQAPNNRAMLAAAPPARSGGASGMLSTARLLGQTGGAALVALVFNAVPHRANEAALLLGVGFVAVAIVVSLLRLMPTAGPPPTSVDTAGHVD